RPAAGRGDGLVRRAHQRDLGRAVLRRTPLRPRRRPHAAADAAATAAPRGRGAPMTVLEGVRAAAVEVHGAHKAFGTHTVLHGIDLVIRPGTVTVVLGPSGSGKSTLLRAINHLEK